MSARHKRIVNICIGILAPAKIRLKEPREKRWIVKLATWPESCLFVNAGGSGSLGERASEPKTKGKRRLYNNDLLDLLCANPVDEHFIIWHLRLAPTVPRFFESERFQVSQRKISMLVGFERILLGQYQAEVHTHHCSLEDLSSEISNRRRYQFRFAIVSSTIFEQACERKNVRTSEP